MKIQFSLILFCCYNILQGQYMSPEPGIVFSDIEVPRIDMVIDTNYLNLILHEDSLDSNIEYPATFIFQSSEANDTLTNIGFRLRGNTSRKAKKKSFKVSFNSFENGLNYHGLEKLNLNGEHNDPSIIRSKFCWDLYQKMGVPASRSNHVRLYINNEYKGLYINVEHIDEEFIQKRMSDGTGNLWKCLWPADLHFLGADPELYANASSWGKKTYELKTNQEENDYSKLAKFIHVLNNVDGLDFVCELEEIFDVDSYLKIMALDILVGNWDGPIINKNNFYLYHNPTSDKITYIPYDLDNTLGIDWFGVNWENTNIYSWSSITGEYRPIYEEIMDVPSYKERFTFYMDSLLANYFNPPTSYAYLDAKREQIAPYRVDDVYASLDYGYSLEDFYNSYNDAIDSHVKIGLKNYVYKRHLSAKDQLQVLTIQPFVTATDVIWSPNEIIFEFTAYQTNQFIPPVFHYQVNDADWKMAELDFAMNGKISYTLVVPEDGVLNYYLALANDNNSYTYYPACQNGQEKLGYDPVHDLVINEFMASNSTDTEDEYGEYDDWIEIYNNSSHTVPLFDYYISDDKKSPNKFKLPNQVLGPNEYLIIWADNDPEQGANHANFKLKKSGEFIGIFDGKDNHFAVLDSIRFPAQKEDISYGRIPNGSGEFVETMWTTFGYNNEIASDNSLLNEEVLKVYPNPASNIIHITSSDLLNYKVLGLDGRTMLQGCETSIDISMLVSGIYILKLKSQSGQWVKHKIVISH